MAKKIIVVDDSPTTRLQLSMALRNGGFDVVEATNGVEGLSAIQGNPDAVMVITDVNMPQMDGLTMLETARKRGLAASIPVMFVTTEASSALRARAKQAGANGWIVKPVAPASLVQAARQLT